MKTQANQVRAGNVIELEGKLYLITKHEIIIPGKGNAVIHFEMKDVVTGIKNLARFRTNVDLERHTLEQQPCQYLYENDNVYMFMNKESFEQFEVQGDFLGEKAQWLQEGMDIYVETYEDRVLGIQLPMQVTLEIVDTEPAIKGQTAANSYKPAILSNGVRTSVPQFVDAGTKIVVKTEDASYVERAK